MSICIFMEIENCVNQVKVVVAIRENQPSRIIWGQFDDFYYPFLCMPIYVSTIDQLFGDFNLKDNSKIFPM